MEWILGSMLLVSLGWNGFFLRKWMVSKSVAEMQAKEIERLKNVAKLHCDQIDTLQKEKKGWHNKNKLLNETNNKLVQRNMELDRAVTFFTKALDATQNELSQRYDEAKAMVAEFSQPYLTTKSDSNSDYYVAYPEQGDDE